MPLLNSENWLIWTQVIVLAIGTFLIRVSFIHLEYLVERFPASLNKVLDFIPGAIIAAIVFPEVISFRVLSLAEVFNDRVLAAGIAFIISWYTKSMFATILGGMMVLWIINML